MSSGAALTAVTAAIGGIAIATTPASPNDAQEAIPGLPDHLVVAHISDLSISTTPPISHGSQR